MPKPLTKGPFYLLGPVKLLITFTDGGLAVDTTHRVLDGSGRPIPGLYAAGTAGQVGLLLEGHGHHLGWAFTSGRVAGRNAAFESVSPVGNRPDLVGIPKRRNGVAARRHAYRLSRPPRGLPSDRW